MYIYIELRTSVGLGLEHAHSIALSNHTSSNNTLSLMPSSTVHSRDSQGSSVKGKNVIIKAPVLGSPLFASEAQFSPNPFPTNNPSPFNELTKLSVGLLSPLGRGGCSFLLFFPPSCCMLS